MVLIRRLSVLMSLVLLVCSNAYGQDQKLIPLPVDRVLARNTLGEMFPMQLSPDGRYLAYVVHTRRPKHPFAPDLFESTGVTWYGYECDLFVEDLMTGTTTNITSGVGSNWLPRWSPNGEYVAFLSDRGGQGQAGLWLWEVHSKTLRMVSGVPVRMLSWERPQWTPDSQGILVTAVPTGTSVSDYGRTDHTGSTSYSPETPSVDANLTVSVYRSLGKKASGDGSLDAGIIGMKWTVQDLLCIDIRSGVSKTLVHRKPISAFLISPDGSRVIYASPQHFETLGSLRILYDLISIPTVGGAETIVATAARLGLSGAISISPDNQKLAYCERVASATDVHIISLEDGNHSDEVHRGSTSAMDDHGPDSTLPLWRDDGKEIYVVRKGTLWRVAVGGGADTRIERIPGREISSVVGVDRHRRSLVVMTYDDVGKRNGFYALDLRTGRSTLLHEAAEVYGSTDAFNEEGVAVAKGGTRLSYIAESAGSPPDIWTANIGFTKCVRATEINPLLSEYKMGSVQRITWLSADGEPLAGALLLPAEYQAGHRYPLVVNVYGGSRLSDYMNRFGGLVIPYDNIQLLATRGYAVLMPDAPQHEGTPMLDLAKTVLGGVNKAIELGVADADRVGVMGSSYGGYSVLSLLVQTNRFRAAVETSGFAEIPGLYGEMKEDGSAFGLLAEHGQELMGGTLWEFRDRYIENSPLFFLDRVETPLLIVHGEQDSGVGVFLGDQIFVSLRRLGKEVEYGKYRNEGHAFFGLANQEDAANRIINWFDRHLKGTAQSSSP